MEHEKEGFDARSVLDLVAEIVAMVNARIHVRDGMPS